MSTAYISYTGNDGRDVEVAIPFTHLDGIRARVTYIEEHGGHSVSVLASSEYHHEDIIYEAGTWSV